jgi:predicted glycoside hydrolase/deacetylase ChbG (UPF0249 family)
MRAEEVHTMPLSTRLALLALAAGAAPGYAAPATTYAERLGWEKGARVLIMHCDDAGMSYDSNVGTIESMTRGVVTSASVMMPCPWVPDFVRRLKKHPDLDIGLHLTLTSEWGGYRWGPLAGKPAVPGLCDPEGCFWRSVPQVILNATADEVETEIRAQIARARSMGMTPTHLDSHMGTLFYSPAFFARYVAVGIEEQIPVFVAASFQETVARLFPSRANELEAGLERIWNAGLPVLDHYVSATGEWRGADKEARYRGFIERLKPGITMAIVHCTRPSETFAAISGSGPKRLEDLRAVTDPAFRQLLEEAGIVLTTWRELKNRRDRIAASTPKNAQ